MRAQQLVVDAVELALADGAGRLQVLDRPRTHRQPHDAHAARDRPARDEHDVVAGRVARRGLGADALDDAGAQLAVVLGDDARTELDDIAGHARLSLRAHGRHAGGCAYPSFVGREYAPILASVVSVAGA